MSVQSGRWRWCRGKVVAVQVSLAVVLAGGGHPAAVAVAVALLAVALTRLRGRSSQEWLHAAVGLWARRGRAWAAARSRTRGPVRGSGPTLDRAGAAARPVTVAALARPAVTVVGDNPPALLADRYGTSAVLDLEGPAGGLPLAPPGADLAASLAASVKPLVYGFAAPATADPPAASYQELTGGGAVTVQRLLLVVRVPRGADLGAAVRMVRRQLDPIPARPLDPAGWEEVLDDLGCRPPVQERWSEVVAGGWRHVAYRVVTPPGTLAGLLPDLLGLPAAVTAVAPHRGDAVTVRTLLDSSDIGTVETALARRLAGTPARSRRLDGEHLPALATTSPLPDPYAMAGGSVPEVPIGPAGLMLGHDREGAAVLLPLSRPRPLRVVLVGPAPWGHLLAWRGLGAGARVVIQTCRPRSWQPVMRAAGGCQPLLSAPDRPPAIAADARHPLLLLVDDGAAPGWPASATGGRQAQVVLRERVTAADVDLLTRADLVLVPALDERAATLVSAALGLGHRSGHLRTGAAETLTVISDGELRPVRVNPTRAERTFTGISMVVSGQSGPPPGERESVRHGKIRAWESS